jgi:hypothetical protein
MNETRQSLLLRARTGQTDAWKAVVYVAKSRVLARIRQEAEGLID